MELGTQDEISCPNTVLKQQFVFQLFDEQYNRVDSMLAASLRGRWHSDNSFSSLYRKLNESSPPSGVEARPACYKRPHTPFSSSVPTQMHIYSVFISISISIGTGTNHEPYHHLLFGTSMPYLQHRWSNPPGLPHP